MHNCHFCFHLYQFLLYIFDVMLISAKDLWLCLTHSFNIYQELKIKGKIKCDHSSQRTRRVLGKHTQRHDNNTVRVAREVRNLGGNIIQIGWRRIAGHYLVKQSDRLPCLMILSSVLLHFIIVPFIHFHSFVSCCNWIFS